MSRTAFIPCLIHSTALQTTTLNSLCLEHHPSPLRPTLTIHQSMLPLHSRLTQPLPSFRVYVRLLSGHFSRPVVAPRHPTPFSIAAFQVNRMLTSPSRKMSFSNTDTGDKPADPYKAANADNNVS